MNGSGILTGATGVNVNGTVYDVEFVEDSCVVAFSGCAVQLAFSTQSDALAAAQALLDQVRLALAARPRPRRHGGASGGDSARRRDHFAAESQHDGRRENGPRCVQTVQFSKSRARHRAGGIRPPTPTDLTPSQTCNRCATAIRHRSIPIDRRGSSTSSGPRWLSPERMSCVQRPSPGRGSAESALPEVRKLDDRSAPHCRSPERCSLLRL